MRNSLHLKGFASDGQLVFEQRASFSEDVDLLHRWQDPAFIRSHGITRLTGMLFSEAGDLDQTYERSFDTSGKYTGGTIQYADGRVLTATTGGKEPSVICLGGLHFTVHYLQNTGNPNAPAWAAFTMYGLTASGHVYPSHLFHWPAGTLPEASYGYGNTHLEAYSSLRGQVCLLRLGTPQHDSIS